MTQILRIILREVEEGKRVIQVANHVHHSLMKTPGFLLYYMFCHFRSSDPASYEDILHRRQHSTSRSKARSSSATRNGDLHRSSTPRSSSKRKQQGNNDIRSSCKRHGDSSKKEGQHQSLSRDSGIDERRESLSLTCSNCHQSTGGSSW